MAWNSITESIIRIYGEADPMYSCSIKVIRIENSKLTGTVFYGHHENILTKTVGNYSQPYEYFHVTGKKENNLNFRNFPIITIFPVIPNIHNTSSFLVQTTSIASKAIFKERFSAPGQKETLGVGQRNLDSDEYAVYNSINFRNLGVRTQLNTDSKNHESGSSYTTHKLAANNQYRFIYSGNSVITQTQYDNLNISHAIPYHNDQINWLYNSLNKNKNDWIEHFIKYSYQTGSEYFYTNSMTGSELVQSRTFISDLNSIYGVNTWTQIRSNQNYKSRLLKSNCFININPDEDSDTIFTTEEAQ